MIQIVEYPTQGINSYIIVANGILREVTYQVTKAALPQETITYIFEVRDNLPLATFTITPYRGGEEVKGIYLNTVVRRNSELVHFYYEKDNA